MTTTPEATITRGPAERAAARPGALRWFDICSYAELTPERGACAMVAGTQVAVFRTFDGALYALSNLDPFSGAHVAVAGDPRHPGRCADRRVPHVQAGVRPADRAAAWTTPGSALPAFPVRRAGDRVEVALPDEHRQ